VNARDSLARAMPILAEAAMSFAAKQIIEAATVQTYIVATYHLPPGGKCACRSIEVVQAHSRPKPEDCIPAGSEFLRATVMPVHMLREMPVGQRLGMGDHWRAYLLWCKAQDLRKSVADLKAWEDYDVVTMDTDVSNWVRGRRFAA